MENTPNQISSYDLMLINRDILEADLKELEEKIKKHEAVMYGEQACEAFKDMGKQERITKCEAVMYEEQALYPSPANMEK